MVAMVMLMPAMVMHYKGDQSQVDPSSVKIDVQGGYGEGAYGGGSNDPGALFK
ncbi:hypothetical protein BOSP111201_17410 [Bordetella sputigena]